MKSVLFFLLILSLSFPLAFADELFITYTDADSQIILDGIWSHKHEWKKSSETIVKQDEQQLFVLRYAHNYETIFVLVDVVSDNFINSNDKAVLCFDSEMKKESSDSIYCFEKIFDKEIITFTNNPSLKEYIQIKNFSGLNATSGESNEFDRYSKKPHTSFEFQIPINEIGRSDVYKFYAEIYDDEKNQIMTWPANSEDESLEISNSTKWGKMISPDKTIPEFSSPLTIFLFLIIPILFFQFKAKIVQNLS
jgi:hypothetical protein